MSPGHPPIPGGEEPRLRWPGWPAQVDALRRQVEPLTGLRERVDDLAGLLAELTETVTALTARRGPTPCPSWLVLPTDDELARRGARRARRLARTASTCATPTRAQGAAGVLVLAPRRRRGTALADARLAGRLPGHRRVGRAGRRLARPPPARRRPPACAAASGPARSRPTRPAKAGPGETGGPPIVPGVEALPVIAQWWGPCRHEDAPEPGARHAREPTDDRRTPFRPGGRAVLWLPGLAVALGAAVATAHGLYEVALAAAVPAGIAWLYPLITDGLALVAYGATARLSGSAARYAWAVVVVAAGLSGLAQAAFLAVRRHPRRLTSAAVRDRRVARRRRRCRRAPALPPGQRSSTRVRDGHRSTAVQPSSRPIRATGGSEPRRPSNARAASTVAVQGRRSLRRRPRPRAGRGRPHLRHAARHGALPTVSALAAAADVSRGTAATVLKPLRGRPLPLHLINTNPDDDTIEERNQP